MGAGKMSIKTKSSEKRPETVRRNDRIITVYYEYKVEGYDYLDILDLIAKRFRIQASTVRTILNRRGYTSMVDRPKQVILGGRVYPILYRSDPIRGSDGKLLNGWIRYNKSQIEINGERAAEYLKLVMAHECFHGVADEAVVELFEKKIERLSRVFLAFIRCNPEVVAFLQEIGSPDGN